MTNADEERFLKLIERINKLEVLVDNLRVKLETHSHPWKPEPRYA
jgi:hypothetical protein